MNQTEYEYIQKRRKKRKQKSTMLAWSLVIIVCMVAILIVTLIHNIRNKNQSNIQDTSNEEVIEKIDRKEDEISPEMLAYLSDYLEDSFKKEFTDEIEKKRRENGYLEYQKVIDSFLLFGSKQSEPIAEETYHILEVSENMIKVIKEDEVLEYEYSSDDLAFSQIGDLSCGDTLSCIGCKNHIIMVLQIQKEDITLEKVWIRDNQESVLEIEYKNHLFQFEKQSSDYDGYYNIADIVLREGCVVSISPFLNKVNGKLLSVTPNDEDGSYCIELENGEYESASSDILVYRLYDQIERVSLNDLIIGYDYTDFVLDNENKVIAALMARYEDMTSIRVVIKNSDYSSAMHDEVTLYCDSLLQLKVGETVTEIEPDQEITVNLSSEYFDHNKRIYLLPKVQTGQIHITSINRSQGKPSYRGQLELQKTSSGILIVNELPLNEYLYSVVPSEMPSSYPKEALKAQAVSARTYAYMHMMHSGLAKYGAHVDDSAGFQVYNNCQETNATTEAVCETKDEILTLNGKPVTTYFYSTSCGLGTDLSAWKYKESQYSDEENAYLKSKTLSPSYVGDEAIKAVSNFANEESSFEQFIKSMPNDFYEADESYFRWKYETSFDQELFYEQLKARYEANGQAVLTYIDGEYQSRDIKDTGNIKAISVTERAPGGAIKELTIESEKATYKVLTEKNARYLLAGSNTTIWLGRGYEKESSIHGMLPSGFFVIELQSEDDGVTGYCLYGGGFGHGIGMSQNGAKNMAIAGKDYKEILSLSYQGTSLDVLD